MATVIDMPKLSDTMSVGTLVSWLKNEGDMIEPGDLIAEVETDKATMELEAFDEGILLKQVANAGDEIPIGGAVAVIGNKGESVDLAALGVSVVATPKEEIPEENPEPAQTEPKEPAPAPVVKVAVPSDGRIKASPLARKLAEKSGIDLATIQGTGPGGRIVKADVESSSGEASIPVTAAPSTVTPVIQFRFIHR